MISTGEVKNICLTPLTLESLGYNVSSTMSQQALSQAAATLGRKGGKSKSAAKAKAARINGRKGGKRAKQ